MACYIDFGVIESIDENGGGSRGAATKAASEEELGSCAGGKATAVVRLLIDNWAKQQDDKPSRSEAIRRLIEFALAAKPKRQSSRGEK
jgi:hypothetical protein